LWTFEVIFDNFNVNKLFTSLTNSPKNNTNNNNFAVASTKTFLLDPKLFPVCVIAVLLEYLSRVHRNIAT
jgi:hypothetical protein